MKVTRTPMGVVSKALPSDFPADAFQDLKNGLLRFIRHPTHDTGRFCLSFALLGIPQVKYSMLTMPGWRDVQKEIWYENSTLGKAQDDCCRRNNRGDETQAPTRGHSRGGAPFRVVRQNFVGRFLNARLNAVNVA